LHNGFLVLQAVINAEGTLPDTRKSARIARVRKLLLDELQFTRVLHISRVLG
jgi:hypothetical protein